jgi:hypothetical protein
MHTANAATVLEHEVLMNLSAWLIEAQAFVIVKQTTDLCCCRCSDGGDQKAKEIIRKYFPQPSCQQDTLEGKESSGITRGE